MDTKPTPVIEAVAPVAAPVVETAPAVLLVVPAAPVVEKDTAEKDSASDTAEKDTAVVGADASVPPAMHGEMPLISITILLLSVLGMLVRKIKKIAEELGFAQAIGNSEMKRLSDALVKVEGRLSDSESLLSRIESLERSLKAKPR